jgi:predicted DNA-binding protein
MSAYFEKQKKQHRTSIRLPDWMEHQCKRIGLFESKSTSKVIREAINEYLEGKEMGYGSYLQVQGKFINK